jgi:hypothetical protein
MRVLRSLLILATFGSAPHMASAQTTRCATGAASTPLSLAAFAGQYRLDLASSEDGTNEAHIAPFDGFDLPPIAGVRRSLGRRDHHGNVYDSEGWDSRMRLYFSRIEAARRLKTRLNAEGEDTEDLGRGEKELASGLRWGGTNAFCVNEHGPLHLRSGFFFDQRWKWAGSWWDALGNGDWPSDFRHSGGMGAATPLPGSGFPTMRYHVRQGAEQDAQTLADRFYNQLDSFGSNLVAYELDLAGTIQRRMRIQYKICGERDIGCVIVSWFGTQKVRPDTTYYYSRGMSGLVRMRIHVDARIGTAANPVPETGYLQHTVFAIFNGSEVGATARTRIRKSLTSHYTVEEVVAMICGTIQGCSAPVGYGTPVGTEHFAAVDDSVRTAQFCRSTARAFGDFSAAECDRGDSEYRKSLVVTSTQIDSALSTPAVAPPPTAAERTNTLSGNRGAGTGTSQMQRICERLIAEEAASGAPRATLPPELAGMTSSGPTVPPECDRYRKPPPR